MTADDDIGEEYEFVKELLVEVKSTAGPCRSKFGKDTQRHHARM
jgi:hypothetical protein